MVLIADVPKLNGFIVEGLNIDLILLEQFTKFYYLKNLLGSVGNLGSVFLSEEPQKTYLQCGH